MKRVLPFAALHQQENHRGLKLPSDSSSFLSFLIFAFSIVAITSSNAGGFIFYKLYPNDPVESTLISEYDSLNLGKDSLTYTTRGSTRGTTVKNSCLIGTIEIPILSGSLTSEAEIQPFKTALNRLSSAVQQYPKFKRDAGPSLQSLGYVVSQWDKGLILKEAKWVSKDQKMGESISQSFSFEGKTFANPVLKSVSGTTAQIMHSEGFLKVDVQKLDEKQIEFLNRTTSSVVLTKAGSMVAATSTKGPSGLHGESPVGLPEVSSAEKPKAGSMVAATSTKGGGGLPGESPAGLPAVSFAEKPEAGSMIATTSTKAESGSPGESPADKEEVSSAEKPKAGSMVAATSTKGESGLPAESPADKEEVKSPKSPLEDTLRRMNQGNVDENSLVFSASVDLSKPLLQSKRETLEVLTNKEMSSHIGPYVYFVGSAKNGVYAQHGTLYGTPGYSSPIFFRRPFEKFLTQPPLVNKKSAGKNFVIDRESYERTVEGFPRVLCLEKLLRDLNSSTKSEQVHLETFVNHELIPQTPLELSNRVKCYLVCCLMVGYSEGTRGMSFVGPLNDLIVQIGSKYTLNSDRTPSIGKWVNVFSGGFTSHLGKEFIPPSTRTMGAQVWIIDPLLNPTGTCHISESQNRPDVSFDYAIQIEWGEVFPTAITLTVDLSPIASKLWKVQTPLTDNTSDAKRQEEEKSKANREADRVRFFDREVHYGEDLVRTKVTAKQAAKLFDGSTWDKLSDSQHLLVFPQKESKVQILFRSFDYATLGPTADEIIKTGGHQYARLGENAKDRINKKLLEEFIDKSFSREPAPEALLKKMGMEDLIKSMEEVSGVFLDSIYVDGIERTEKETNEFCQENFKNN